MMDNNLLGILVVFNIVFLGLAIFNTIAMAWVATVAHDLHRLIAPILKAEDSDEDEGYANPD